MVLPNNEKLLLPPPPEYDDDAAGAPKPLPPLPELHPGPPTYGPPPTETAIQTASTSGNFNGS